MNTHIEGIVLTPGMIDVLKKFQDPSFRMADYHIHSINKIIRYFIKNRINLGLDESETLNIISELFCVTEDLKEFDFVDTE